MKWIGSGITLLGLSLLFAACSRQPDNPVTLPAKTSSLDVQPAPKNDPAVFLARIAGVYKTQFENGLVDGEKFKSEDILEVVPVDDHAAYVRMDLEFYNGHSGKISGIATSARQSLIYDNGKTGEERCVVEFIWSSERVVSRADYDKTPGCSYYHGARGTLDGAQFATKNRREIRYMQRLKESQEFKEAMDGYRTHPPSVQAGVDLLNQSSQIPEGEARFTDQEQKDYYLVYENADVKYLRTVFDAYLHCTSERSEEFELLRKWNSDYYRSKFIVASRDPTILGGTVITIVFQDHPDKVFVAWIYSEGPNQKLTLREFEPGDFSVEDLKRIPIRYRTMLADKVHAM